ncbi:hypothetical protein SK128_009698 [Halocaridina rubra]|uniref:Uncharacterized protein n=1 Tax=Halocaridina rubra TaxID=373956 RepID=A0AAN9A2S7_HALRR
MQLRLTERNENSAAVPVLRHGLPFQPRARTVAFLRKTCFGRCDRCPECMPLLTSDRDGARTLDLTSQSRGRYRLIHEQGREKVVTDGWIRFYVTNSLFLLRARTVAFFRRTCFGRCNRYPECMPLLTSLQAATESQFHDIH